MQMLSAFSLIIGNDILAQMMVGYGMTIGAAFVIFIICKRFYTTEVGLYAMLIFLTTYVVEFLVGITFKIMILILIVKYTRRTNEKM